MLHCDRHWGASNVVTITPAMTSGRLFGVRERGRTFCFYYELGVANPQAFTAGEGQGNQPAFQSLAVLRAVADMEPSLKTAIESEVSVLRTLMSSARDSSWRRWLSNESSRSAPQIRSIFGTRWQHVTAYPPLRDTSGPSFGVALPSDCW